MRSTQKQSSLEDQGKGMNLKTSTGCLGRSDMKGQAVPEPGGSQPLQRLFHLCFLHWPSWAQPTTDGQSTSGVWMGCGRKEVIQQTGSLEKRKEYELRTSILMI